MNISTTALYSLNGSFPEKLPHRIRLADGSTKTDPSTFTPEDLADLGYEGPIVLPSYEDGIQKLIWDSKTLTATVVDVITDDPNITEEDIRNLRKESLIIERNKKLINTDWTQLPDSGLNETKILEYQKYRQELRDFTKVVGFGTTGEKDDLMYYKTIDDLPWPIQPE